MTDNKNKQEKQSDDKNTEITPLVKSLINIPKRSTDDNLNSILTVESAGSSAIKIVDGKLKVEHPGLLKWILTTGKAMSNFQSLLIFLRVFEKEAYGFMENKLTGVPIIIPEKTIYGWGYQKGEFYPLKKEEVEKLHRRSPEGRETPLEPGVNYGDAWKIERKG